MEVACWQWEEQITLWRESVRRVPSGLDLVVSAVSVSSEDKGKAHMDEGSTLQQNQDATTLTDAEVAKLVQERDEAL